MPGDDQLPPIFQHFASAMQTLKAALGAFVGYKQNIELDAVPFFLQDRDQGIFRPRPKRAHAHYIQVEPDLPVVSQTIGDDISQIRIGGF